MRAKLALGLAALALAAASVSGCESAPRKDRPPRKTYPEDPEAAAHAAKGLEIWKEVEDARDPADALSRSLAELEKARERVPSPRNRFLCARVAHVSLVQDPKKKPPEDELAKVRESVRAIVEEDPDHAASLGLLALLEATAPSPDLDSAAAHAEHACAVALGSSDRALRCFVGDQAADAAKAVWRKDPARAADLMLAASRLGSPSALVNVAKLDWEGRGRKVDRDAAVLLAKQAAETTFTPDERASALLVNESYASRFASRLLGNYLVQLARFAEALPALERGVSCGDDALLPNERPNPDFRNALAQKGEVEAFGLAGKADPRGYALLEEVARGDHAPAHVLLGRLDAAAGKADAAKARFEEAAKLGSQEALACLRSWEKLAKAASAVAAAAAPSKRADVDPEIQLYALRTLFLALALEKGTAAREEVEELARKAADPAPKTRPSARQLRHIAGDLSAEELQATKPVSALLPRWRAETELALAIRALLVGDKKSARDHLESCIDAHAITNPEGELAWAALQALK